jgi:SAM-dependent methyltransferase
MDGQEHQLSEEEAAAMFEPRSWDERYGGDGQIWSGNPNAQLVAEVSALSPGTALDVGCGEGADVIWLARQGWRVTGADFSANGLVRAARHAEQAGVGDRTDWWQVDARTFTADGRSYDLVTTHFLHPPDGGPAQRNVPRRRPARRSTRLLRCPRGRTATADGDPRREDGRRPRFHPARALPFSVRPAASLRRWSSNRC